MREQVTLAVDANGYAYYVDITDRLKHYLSVESEGAGIDDWPGDFPVKKLQPGFYSALVAVSGTRDNPELAWSSIHKLTAHPPWVQVQKVPEAQEKAKRKPKQKTQEPTPELQVRVRRKGEVLV